MVADGSFRLGVSRKPARPIVSTGTIITAHWSKLQIWGSHSWRRRPLFPCSAHQRASLPPRPLCWGEGEVPVVVSVAAVRLLRRLAYLLYSAFFAGEIRTRTLARMQDLLLARGLDNPFWGADFDHPMSPLPGTVTRREPVSHYFTRSVFDSANGTGTKTAPWNNQGDRLPTSRFHPRLVLAGLGRLCLGGSPGFATPVLSSSIHRPSLRPSARLRWSFYHNCPREILRQKMAWHGSGDEPRHKTPPSRSGDAVCLAFILSTKATRSRTSNLIARAFPRPGNRIGTISPRLVHSWSSRWLTPKALAASFALSRRRGSVAGRVNRVLTMAPPFGRAVRWHGRGRRLSGCCSMSPYPRKSSWP